MYFQPIKLGILGGGQLGKMLIQEAVNLNIEVHVLDPDENCPSRFLAKNFVCGDFRDFTQVYEFGKNVDILTIEIEHINVEALYKLSNEGVKVFPQPEVIEIIQDKGLQKQFFIDHNIPTSEFELVDSTTNLAQKFGGNFCQKLRKGGYDGKGVQIIKNSNLDSAFVGPCVIEKLVTIQKEISVIVARDESGNCAVYEPVECQFNPKENLVEFLQMPADLDNSQTSQVKLLAKKVSEDLKIVGILAVEMFIDASGEILINELAPRPHNSGHQTIESCYTSQFEQHLRSILGLPLGSCGVIQPSVMVNILGESGHQGEAKYTGLQSVLQLEGCHVHLYGKKITKPFRKMGHVTVINKDIEMAKILGRKVLSELKVVTNSDHC